MRPSRLACPLRRTTALLHVLLSLAALATAASAARTPAPPHRPQ